MGVTSTTKTRIYKNYLKLLDHSYNFLNETKLLSYEQTARDYDNLKGTMTRQNGSFTRIQDALRSVNLKDIINGCEVLNPDTVKNRSVDLLKASFSL
ncbi:hypothetical protein M514_03020 [Trichuris suis]|uniref:Uncharacterized protein n=1 Tax=Trichuris suis TaxID=68888 RepID=A0A085NI01_9BILA|nr:hypothetical protein M513_03020 [Trichuris suis]KFD69097.1 hypothetical protein M514_03020 [Trichuris suis]